MGNWYFAFSFCSHSTRCQYVLRTSPSHPQNYMRHNDSSVVKESSVNDGEVNLLCLESSSHPITRLLALPHNLYCSTLCSCSYIASRSVPQCRYRLRALFLKPSLIGERSCSEYLKLRLPGKSCSPAEQNLLYITRWHTIT